MPDSVRNILFALFSLSLTSLAHATLVGKTAGSFQVSPSGAATYSVPIQVPPGTNDMQPSLSLSYNSQGGNGLLGTGWNIGGLSAIVRCPATQVQDGFKGNINFDSNDRFCLDGQRLLAISGTYGGDGTEYRTAVNSFSKIVSYGTAGNGPAYFKVWTKSGQIMEYATTNDSRVEAQGKTDVLFWALSKVEDRNSNYLTISYAEDNANGESYPTEIYYTGNTTQGLTPTNHIQFVYENRTDVSIRYVAGSVTKTQKRLSKIGIFSGASPVKEYRISYAYGDITQTSQPLSITECTGIDECLLPISLTWGSSNDITFTRTENGPDTFIDGQSLDYANFTLSCIKYGDFNGDGITDVYRIRGWGDNKSDAVYFANGDGTFTKTTNGPFTFVDDKSLEYAYFSINRIKFGDFNGDGMTDVYRVRGWGETKADLIYLSNGDGTFTTIDGPATFVDDKNLGYANLSINRIKFGDFNGDGLTDVYRINGWDENKPDTIHFANSDGTFTTTKVGPATKVSGASLDYADYSINRLRFGDFNGDGMTDVYRINGWDKHKPDTIYFSNGDGTFTTTNNGPDTKIAWSSTIEYANFSLSRIKTGDFNGDGLTDIYRVNGWDEAKADTIYFSNGDGTFTTTTNGPATKIAGTDLPYLKYSLNRIKFVDLNGDGKTDVYRVNGWDQHKPDTIYFSNGDGAFTTTSTGPNTKIDWKSIEYANFSINRIQFGDFNGDGIADVYLNRGWGDDKNDLIYLNNTKKQHVTSITNSLSAHTNITYSSLTNSSTYTKGTGATYPERDFQAPIYVVSQTHMDNGIEGEAVTNYTYRGMKVHLEGRGSLGFAGMEVINITGDIKTSVNNMQEYPYIGMSSHTEKRVVSTNQLLSESDATYTYKSPFTGDLLGPVAPYASQSVAKTYDLTSGQILSTTTTIPSFDDYGNPVTTTKAISGNGKTFSEVTTNYYTVDTTNWCLSMTNQSDVTLTGADSSTITRSTTFGWDATKCRLTQSTILPGEGDSLEMTTVYGYDSFGNRISESVSGPVDAARTTLTDYTSNNAAYPDGQFATMITNVLGHSENREYDARFGVVTKMTGPNGISTCFEYDELGRNTVERQYCGTPQETTTTTSYAWCDTSCPQYASYMVTTQQTGSAPVTVYYDKLNRELRKSVVGFSGNQIYVDTQYDDKGRVAASSEPYFDGDNTYWSVYTYDVLGRVETLKPPHTTQLVTTSYNGYTTTVTDVMGRQSSKTENAMGQTESVTDALLNVTTYQYDAGGNLTTTTDSVGNVISLTYDKRDRKIAMSDPDMGDWSYSYNTFGELLAQTDAKGQVTTLTYDLLGRMISRDTAEGESTWTYDTATKGIGKLARMDGAGGSAREFIYDTLGRPSQVIDHIDMDAFTTTRTYDSVGRIDTVTYPANFEVQHVYTGNGYLQQVQSTDATPVVYWKADSMNARGQILDSTLGNGVHTSRAYNDATGWIDGIYTFDSAMTTVQLNAYSFDAVGNLVSRSDQRQGLTESFTYDDLDRVLTADIAGGSGTYVPRNYSYDALGNITSKSDVGNYLYGENGAGPHAVTQAGTHTYDYDANGNMISGAGRTIGYTSFNKPNVITDSGTTVTFTYGADKSRILKVVGSKRTVYVGLGAEGNALYERETDGSSVKHRHYIYAGGGQAVAIHTNDGTNDAVEYLHRDHLGSIEAITDASGQITERMSFDVWGKQRSVDWSDVPLGNYIVNSTNLGFTGHESIPEVGYIHMNGRVYDPVIGRFLSADSHVQTATDMQSYNRYSYVSNNPLRYTDPTGYFLQGIMSAVHSFIRNTVNSISDGIHQYGTIVAAAVISYYTGGLASGWFSSYFGPTIIGGAFGGAIGSAAYAASYVALNGGNINEVLQAAGSVAESGAASGVMYGVAGAIFGTTLQGKMVAAAVIAMASGGNAQSVVTAAGTAAFMHFASPYLDKLIGQNASQSGAGQADAGLAESSPLQSYNNSSFDDLTGAYCPAPGEYYTENGELLSVNLEVFSNGNESLVTLDGLTAYGFDYKTGLLINPMATGALDSVCPSCYLIGGGSITWGAFKGWVSGTLSGPRVGHRLFTATRSNGTWNTGKYRFGWSGKNGSNTYKLMFRYKYHHVPTGFKTYRPHPNGGW